MNITNHSGNKYLRWIRACAGTFVRKTNGVGNREYVEIQVDVYAVLRAFNVTDPELQHAVKKLLCSGIRGKGSKSQDVQEAVHALYRALENIEEIPDGRTETKATDGDAPLEFHCGVSVEQRDRAGAERLGGGGVLGGAGGRESGTDRSAGTNPPLPVERANLLDKQVQMELFKKMLSQLPDGLSVLPHALEGDHVD